MLSFVRTALACCFYCAGLTSSVAAQTDEKPTAPWIQWGIANPTWVEKIDPFRMIGNIYFVGTKGLSSFLIVTEDGHILIDTGLPQNAPIVADNITALGFDIKDIKLLLNSHAHFDHSGGLRAFREMSGARILASAGDRSALEGGFYLGYEDNINYTAPPVHVDQIITNGETITRGNTVLITHMTPGHTRGCTSWTMTVQEQGTPYDVLFFCGATVASNRLIPEQYDGIVDDYRHTFEKTQNWQPDVLLVNHPFFFDMEAMRARQIAGDPLAFVNKESFQELIKQLRNAFEASLIKAQTAIAQ